MRPEDLKPGSIITTPISVDQSGNDRLIKIIFAEVIHRLRDPAHELNYVNYTINRINWLARSQPWCFVVEELHPTFVIVNYVEQHSYLRRTFFNIGSRPFGLKYDDIEPLTLPRCDECYNYCGQICVQYLRFEPYA